MKIPHLVAICGYPGAGKSEVQKLLQEIGVQPVDDGGPLRAFAIHSLGLSRDDVYTQEGKKRSSMIADKRWEHRMALGEIGKKLEELFGPDIMPFMATRNLNPMACYSFGSVRRTQAWFYRKLGGLVIGVRRPGVGPSGNDFDEFDHYAVDYWIDNKGTIDDIRTQIEIMLARAPRELLGIRFVP